MQGTRNRAVFAVVAFFACVLVGVLFLLYVNNWGVTTAPSGSIRSQSLDPNPQAGAELFSYPFRIVYLQDEGIYEVDAKNRPALQIGHLPQSVPVYTKVGDDVRDGLIPSDKELAVIEALGVDSGQAVTYEAPIRLEWDGDDWRVVRAQGVFFKFVEPGTPIGVEILYGGEYMGRPYYNFVVQDLSVSID